MAEDLGEIVIRFGDDGGGRRGPTSSTGSASQQNTRSAAEASKAALQGIMQNLPVITRVAQTGMQGGTIGGVLSASRVAAGGLAAAGPIVAAVLAPVLAIAAGIAIVAVTARAIHSVVTSVMDRISDLAKVSGPMAMQQAMNQIAEMRRDMREARVLGPMYSQVAQLVNKIKDLLQPFLLAFRAAILSVIIPLLQAIATYLQRFNDMIPAIAAALSDMANLVNEYMPLIDKLLGKSGAIPSGGLWGLLNFVAPIWMFNAITGLAGFGTTPTGPSTIAGILITMAQTLTSFYSAFQQQTPTGSNAWAINQLDALATGSYAGASVPIQRRNAPRIARPSGATP